MNGLLSALAAPRRLVCLALAALASALPARAGWQWAWGDDFSQPLNGQKWSVYNGPFGTSQNCYFMPSNAFTWGGNLVLVVNTAYNAGGRQFTSGGVDTAYRHTQIYGRWQVRAKFPEGFGLVGYIGLFPENGAWPPEVDFAEVLGREYWACHLTQHYVSSGNKTDRTTVWNSQVGSDFTGWHEYVVEWTPGQIRYYIDGVLRATQPQRFANTPMKLAIGCGTGNPGSWERSPTEAAANGWAWPLGAGKGEVKVDYVNIYRYVP